MHTQTCLVAEPEMAQADVLIAPTTSVSSVSTKDEQERAIQTGYVVARAAMSHRYSRRSSALRGCAVSSPVRCCCDGHRDVPFL
jgi:NTE family protein